MSEHSPSPGLKSADKPQSTPQMSASKPPIRVVSVAPIPPSPNNSPLIDWSQQRGRSNAIPSLVLPPIISTSMSSTPSIIRPMSHRQSRSLAHARTLMTSSILADTRLDPNATEEEIMSALSAHGLTPSVPSRHGSNTSDSGASGSSGVPGPFTVVEPSLSDNSHSNNTSPLLSSSFTSASSLAPSSSFSQTSLAPPHLSTHTPHSRSAHTTPRASFSHTHALSSSTTLFPPSLSHSSSFCIATQTPSLQPPHTHTHAAPVPGVDWSFAPLLPLPSLTPSASAQPPNTQRDGAMTAPHLAPPSRSLGEGKSLQSHSTNTSPLLTALSPPHVTNYSSLPPPASTLTHSASSVHSAAITPAFTPAQPPPRKNVRFLSLDTDSDTISVSVKTYKAADLPAEIAASSAREELMYTEKPVTRRRRKKKAIMDADGNKIVRGKKAKTPGAYAAAVVAKVEKPCAAVDAGSDTEGNVDSDLDSDEDEVAKERDGARQRGDDVCVGTGTGNTSTPHPSSGKHFSRKRSVRKNGLGKHSECDPCCHRHACHMHRTNGGKCLTSEPNSAKSEYSECPEYSESEISEAESSCLSEADDREEESEGVLASVAPNTGDATTHAATAPVTAPATDSGTGAAAGTGTGADCGVKKSLKIRLRVTRSGASGNGNGSGSGHGSGSGGVGTGGVSPAQLAAIATAPTDNALSSDSNTSAGTGTGTGVTRRRIRVPRLTSGYTKYDLNEGAVFRDVRERARSMYGDGDAEDEDEAESVGGVSREGVEVVAGDFSHFTHPRSRTPPKIPTPLPSPVLRAQSTPMDSVVSFSGAAALECSSVDGGSVVSTSGSGSGSGSSGGGADGGERGHGMARHGVGRQSTPLFPCPFAPPATAADSSNSASSGNGGAGGKSTTSADTTTTTTSVTPASGLRKIPSKSLLSQIDHDAPFMSLRVPNMRHSSIYSLLSPASNGAMVSPHTRTHVGTDESGVMSLTALGELEPLEAQLQPLLIPAIVVDDGASTGVSTGSGDVDGEASGKGVVRRGQNLFVVGQGTLDTSNLSYHASESCNSHGSSNKDSTSGSGSGSGHASGGSHANEDAKINTALPPPSHALAPSSPHASATTTTTTTTTTTAAATDAPILSPGCRTPDCAKQTCDADCLSTLLYKHIISEEDLNRQVAQRIMRMRGHTIGGETSGSSGAGSGGVAGGSVSVAASNATTATTAIPSSAQCSSSSSVPSSHAYASHTTPSPPPCGEEEDECVAVETFPASAHRCHAADTAQHFTSSATYPPLSPPSLATCPITTPCRGLRSILKHTPHTPHTPTHPAHSLSSLPPATPAATAFTPTHVDPLHEARARVVTETLGKLLALRVLTRGIRVKVLNDAGEDQDKWLWTSEDGGVLSWSNDPPEKRHGFRKFLVREEKRDIMRLRHVGLGTFVKRREATAMKPGKYPSWHCITLEFANQFPRLGEGKKRAGVEIEVEEVLRNVEIVCPDDTATRQVFMGLQSLMPLDKHSLSFGGFLWKRAALKTRRLAFDKVVDKKTFIGELWDKARELRYLRFKGKWLLQQRADAYAFVCAQFAALCASQVIVDSINDFRKKVVEAPEQYGLTADSPESQHMQHVLMSTILKDQRGTLHKDVAMHVLDTVVATKTLNIAEVVQSRVFLSKQLQQRLLQLTRDSPTDGAGQGGLSLQNLQLDRATLLSAANDAIGHANKDMVEQVRERLEWWAAHEAEVEAQAKLALMRSREEDVDEEEREAMRENADVAGRRGSLFEDTGDSDYVRSRREEGAVVEKAPASHSTHVEDEGKGEKRKREPFSVKSAMMSLKMDWCALLSLGLSTSAGNGGGAVDVGERGEGGEEEVVEVEEEDEEEKCHADSDCECACTCHEVPHSPSTHTHARAYAPSSEDVLSVLHSRAEEASEVKVAELRALASGFQRELWGAGGDFMSDNDITAHARGRNLKNKSLRGPISREAAQALLAQADASGDPHAKVVAFLAFLRGLTYPYMHGFENELVAESLEVAALQQELGGLTGGLNCFEEGK